MSINSKWSEYYTSRIFSYTEIKQLYERGVLSHAGCSLRGVKIQTLIEKGPNCVSCPALVQFFASQRHLSSEEHNKRKSRLHLNGWFVNENGIAILMTADHIVSRANKGQRTIENSQCMCYICNLKKGAKNIHYKERPSLKLLS